jgi:hypothetical protein
MQMKNWKIIQQTGKRAVIVCDNERKEIHRPGDMTLKQFVEALPHKGVVSDKDLAKNFPDVSSSTVTRDQAA